MLTRRTFSVALGASALGACSTLRRDGKEPSPVFAEALANTATPGMAAIVIRNFEAEREQVGGVRALGASAPVARGDRWHLGSNSKSITATLIARLVEAGVLSWERPLAEMLPALVGGMHEAYRDVTLPDLLSHRSGLPENTSDMEFFGSFHADDASPTAQRLRYITRCLQDEPVGPARAAPSYSNTGYLVAVACAEAATGRAYEELVVEEVFNPLGIRSISFDQFGAANEPQGHVDGRIANQISDVNPRMFAPAGAMRMKLADWARYGIDQMQGEHGRGRLLRQETYAFLHTGQGETRSALGWGAAPNPMSLRGPGLTHTGSDGNWFAAVCLFPQTGNGVMVVANAADSMGGDQATVAVLRALAATVAEPAAS